MESLQIANFVYVQYKGKLLNILFFLAHSQNSEWKHCQPNNNNIQKLIVETKVWSHLLIDLKEYFRHFLTIPTG